MNTDSLILSIGLFFLVALTSTVAMSGAISLDVGCHIVGTEINADYSTEYLTLGNC